MRVEAVLPRWLVRAALLGVGIFTVLGVFAGAALAETSSDGSISDVFSPIVTEVDASDTGVIDEVYVEAEFADIGMGIEEGSENIEVEDAEVSECARTKVDNKGRIKCKVRKSRDGEHAVRASARDKAGNYREQVQSVDLTDVQAPVIDAIEADVEKVTVYFHDPSPSSGIASISVSVDGQELHCYVCERHHNGMGPYLGDGHRAHGEGNGTGHYVDENHEVIDNNVFPPPDDGSGTGIWTSDFTCDNEPGLACGPHVVVVTITDNSGNTTTQTTTFQVGDCAPPETTDDAPDGWQTSDVTVTLACTDDVSGCAQTTYEVDGGATQSGNSVLLTADGTHTITYRSRDVEGNSEATKAATVMIDKTPPVITTSGDAIHEATGTEGAAVDYSADATDATSGLASLDCAPASGSTFPLGTTAVNCTATDVAGNTSVSTINISVVDTTPPEVTAESKTVEATGPDGATVDFTSSATDIVDGALPTSCLPASGSTFPLGDTSVNCTATDAAGNTASAGATISVNDTTAPVVAYDGPSGTIITDGDPTVTASATDAVGVTSAMMTVDGGAPIACSVDNGAISCPTSGLAYGWHDIVITASDAAGNVGTATGMFCKSSGAPYLAIVCTGYNYAWDGQRWLLGAFYRFSSDVAPGAYNVIITAESATSNKGALNFVGHTTNPPPPGTPAYNYPDGVVSLPYTLGDIFPGAPVQAVVWYEYVPGISWLTTTVTACADDQCGNTYFEAPVDPLG